MLNIKDAVIIFTNIIYTLIFIRCIISWLPISRDNELVRLLYTLTDPILEPIRNLLDKSPLGGPGMMIDFSPVIAFLLINIISNFIIGIL